MRGTSGLGRMRAGYATGAVWEDYEPEAVAALVGWIRKHPGGQVLDVGSSIGIFSAVALFADDRTDVVAFDSDLNSLAAVRRLCQYAAGARLQLVWGFLGDKETVVQPLEIAASTTEQALKSQSPSGTWGQTDISAWIALTRRAFPAGEWMTSAREREIAFAPCSLNAMWRELNCFVFFRVQAHSGGGECFPALERASTGAAELRTFRGRCEVLFEKH